MHRVWRRSALDVVQGEQKCASRTAQSAAARQQQEWQYARALTIRYMELEDQHEALFPALASAFKLTANEVQRIVAAQRRHADANSLWGRTVSAGAMIGRLAGAFSEAAAEARGGAGAGGHGGAAG